MNGSGNRLREPDAKPIATSSETNGASSFSPTTTAQAVAVETTRQTKAAVIGIDDPNALRDAAVKRSPIMKLQSGLRAITAFADRKTAEASAFMAGNAKPIASASSMDTSLAAMMGDAPACDTCGSITVRNGTCYKCMNCGASLGCS